MKAGTSTPTTDAAAWLAGGGAMGERVRAFDWGSTPLGPISGWAPELRTAAAFVLENRFPAALVWGAGMVTIYNDAFRPILGSKPDALGRSFADIWSEAWNEIGPIAARAFAGESTFIEDYPLLIERSGAPEQAYFTFSYSPVRSVDGTVAGFVDTVVETTQAVRARESLREREQRYRALVTAGSYSIYRMSPDWSVLYELQGQEFLADTEEPLESWVDSYILPEDREHLFAAIRQAIRDKSTFELEHRIRLRDDGGIGWTLSRAVPIIGDDGEIVEWFGAATDVTERRQTEQALGVSEERLRQFGEASQDVLWMRDAETLRWTYLTAAFETIYGVSREDALTGNTMRNWLELVEPEDRKHALGSIRRVLAGERLTFEYRIRRPDGEIRWLRDTDFPMRDDGGRVIAIGGIGQDITEQKRAVEMQSTLLAELQHRVRNTLAVVRSIARRTADRSDSVEEMIAHLEGRLNAFSRVQSVVTRSADGGVDLMAIVEDELLAVAAREGDQLRIDGENILLKPRAAESISLAIHELATNAVKYGALSAPDGCIRISWKRARIDGGVSLQLEWAETGLDGLSSPAREGFGMELLRRTLPYDLGAETQIRIAPDGLRFSMSLPLGADLVATKSQE